MSAAHTAAQMARKYTKRFLGLGWARVLLVLGVVFALLSIASPLWSTTIDLGGGTSTTATYGWTTVTLVSYEGGTWSQTVIRSYTASNFRSNTLANSLSGAYWALAFFLIVLIVITALFSLVFIHRLPNLGLLTIGLVVVVFALVALLYPLLTVPGAAAADLGQSSITGFWGAVGAFGGTFTWGAAIGWWFLLIAVLLGTVGALWPFLQAVRNPVARVPPPPPREWQVER